MYIDYVCGKFRNKFKFNRQVLQKKIYRVYRLAAHHYHMYLFITYILNPNKRMQNNKASRAACFFFFQKGFREGEWCCVYWSLLNLIISLPRNFHSPLESVKHQGSTSCSWREFSADGQLDSAFTWTLHVYHFLVLLARTATDGSGRRGRAEHAVGFVISATRVIFDHVKSCPSLTYEIISIFYLHTSSHHVRQSMVIEKNFCNCSLISNKYEGGNGSP